MFDFVRGNKRFVQVLLILLALSFILIGTVSITNIFGEKPIATYDGGEVTQQDFNSILSNYQAQRREELKGQYSEEMFNTREFRLSVLHNYLNDRLNMAQLERLHLYLSDRFLQSYIASMEIFQVNGQFSLEKYKQELGQVGLTPEAFQQDVRGKLSQGMIPVSVATTAIISDAVASNILDYMMQERQVDSHLFKTENYVVKVSVTDAEIQKYYQNNKTQFEEPEQIKVDFLIFPLENLKDQIEVTDAEIEDAYKKNQAALMLPEKRDMRHILVVVDPSQPNADEAARKKIDGILVQVRQDPGKFSDLAKQYSDDRGSAEAGGAMVEVTQDILDPAFGQALFALKAANDISPVVKSQFGYHIIILDNIHPGEVRPLEDVRADIQAQILQDKLVAEMSRKTPEFSDAVYSQPNLGEVAKLFGLTVQQSNWETQQSILENPVLSNRYLISQLFDPVRINEKQSTDGIEVAPNVLVAARVVEHKPKTAIDFEHAKADIRARLTNQKAEALAKKDGEALITTLRKNPDRQVNWKPEGMIARAQPQQLTDAGLKVVMSADISAIAEQPVFVGALTGNGYTVYRISQVRQAEVLSDEERSMRIALIRQQMTRGAQGDAFAAYQAAVRAKSDIKINEESLLKSATVLTE